MAERGRPDTRAGRFDERLVIGRLVEHGRARYQFRPGETASYFVRLQTDHGQRVLWGKDLERALSESATQPKPGELVGARRVGREALTVTVRERDPDGRIISQSEQLAHRNRWVVEKVQFFAIRSKLAHQVLDRQLDARRTVKQNPELASTFLSLRGAQELAERRIADPIERERFLTLVREAIAGSIQRGSPLPTVRLREPAAKTSIRAHKPKDEPTR